MFINQNYLLLFLFLNQNYFAFVPMMKKSNDVLFRL